MNQELFVILCNGGRQRTIGLQEVERNAECLLVASLKRSWQGNSKVLGSTGQGQLASPNCRLFRSKGNKD